MKPMIKNLFSKTRRLLPMVMAVASLTATAHAAAPGITGPAFNLTAEPAYLTQPDGQSLYSWGYGCTTAPIGYAPFAGFCNTMQVPGPTLIVNQGDTVTVTLTNNLPPSAGNTSILFPGFAVTSSGGATGLVTQEAKSISCDPTTNAGCNVVIYTFTASTPGTHAYYSGTQSDLQIEMGMFGAIIVLPTLSSATSGACGLGAGDSLHGLPIVDGVSTGNNAKARAHWLENDYRLAPAAYDNPKTCYDREYLFQFSEMDPAVHQQAQEQVDYCRAHPADPASGTLCSLHVAMEPYHPAYFMINGRSMPDDMDSNYAVEYPHQPYNGNPHMHPGEMVLLRIIGQGRWQHPFHEHANHVRVLARDGNLILTPNGNALAGPALFTTTTTPGQAMDGLFYYTGRGLNWDMYAHNPASLTDSNAKLPCTPDVDGYNTGAPNAINYFEWCQDHNKPLEASPFGDVANNGPVTLPDPNILVNGAWFGGSPYLGPDATARATAGGCSGTMCGGTGTTPPSGTIANSPTGEAGFAFMWHSHNEREITTNNAFPGGMMMMMLVDSREYPIDETK